MRLKLLAGLTAVMSASIAMCGGALLQNGNFSSLNETGAPASWVPVNNSAEHVSVKREDGRNVVVMKCAAGKPVFLLQPGLVLASDKGHVVKYKVKGSGQAVFRIYVEWVDDSKAADAPDRLKAFVHNGAWQKPSAAWEIMTFSFTSPGANYSKPYIVLNAMGEDGEVCFADVELAEEAQ